MRESPSDRRLRASPSSDLQQANACSAGSCAHSAAIESSPAINATCLASRAALARRAAADGLAEITRRATAARVCPGVSSLASAATSWSTALRLAGSSTVHALTMLRAAPAEMSPDNMPASVAGWSSTRLKANPIAEAAASPPRGRSA